MMHFQEDYAMLKNERDDIVPYNVIVITTDQQRFDSLGCCGSSFVNTPNLDKMASQGVLFNRAYCSNPVCTPSRASIYSGKYISRHGAWNVGMNIPEDEVFVSHMLKNSGYKTHLIGKAHFNAFGGTVNQSKETISCWEEQYPDFKGPYYGFDTVELAIGHTTYGIAGHYGSWVKEKSGETDLNKFTFERKSDISFGGEAYDWDLPLELHNSLWTAEKTSQFLNEMAVSDKPFLLSIGFEDPHHPHALPKEYADKLDPEKIPLPHYIDGELDDKPEHFNIARRGELEESRFKGEYSIAGQGKGADFRKVSDKDAVLGRMYYYGMVELIDKAMGIILDTLEETGLYKNTLVVFTTDHGELLGDHGLWMKGPFLYEQLIKVPCIMQWPGYKYSGKKVNSLISLVDIVPTVLAACDQNIPQKLDGVNLIPLLEDKTESVHESVMVECTDDLKGLRLKTLVTEKYKLTYYYGSECGELYDLENDPWEIKNLWDDKDTQCLKSKLLTKLMNYMEVLEKRGERYAYA